MNFLLFPCVPSRFSVLRPLGFPAGWLNLGCRFGTLCCLLGACFLVSSVLLFPAVPCGVLAPVLWADDLLPSPFLLADEGGGREKLISVEFKTPPLTLEIHIWRRVQDWQQHFPAAAKQRGASRQNQGQKQQCGDGEPHVHPTTFTVRIEFSGCWKFQHTAEFRAGKEEFAEFFLRSEKYSSNFGFLEMAAKKVDVLEERLEGEMNQIKETVEERISSMEGQVADLRDMMKKMLEFQTQSAASDAKGPEAKNTNSEIHQEEEEVEIVEGRRGRSHLEPFQREERGGGYGERQGYGGMEPRGAGWEHREGYYGRRGAVFEDRRGDFEAVFTVLGFKSC
ncbi:hypothetical protein M5K25_017740 [Dendrobium thyrsiflorum]|uniref:Uncharacterized protein n=1 Tax=Dendrobium thyrsiflorum TaxID=117978 RepID=A0ABD0UUS2_DENTH